MRAKWPAIGWASVLVLSTGLSACVDTSPDRVKLTASVSDVSLTVARSSLVTSLAGSFALHLNLGDLADQTATMTDPPTFQLVTASNRSEVAALDAILQGATLPVTVKPGNSVVLSYKLNDQASLPQATLDSACAADVAVAGTLRDSSNGDQPLAFESLPTKPTGCP